MSTQETSQKTSSTLKEKAKGAAHVAHGAGESIFGSMMGAVHSHDEEARAKDDETVAKGRAEVERGFAQMKWKPAPGTTTAGTESQAEGKGAQPQQPAEKQEGTIPAPPEAARQQELAGQAEGKGAQPQQLAEKQQRTSAPPETASQQELAGQADPGMAQKGSQGTQQEAVPKKSPEGECLIGQGADAPQGPGSCIY